MKARGRKPKTTIQTLVNPNDGAVQGAMDKSMPPPQNPNQNNNNAIQHFIMLQSQHLTRLHCLFPEINPAALRKLLDLFKGDFIRTIDYILYLRRKNFLKQKSLLSTPGSFENKRMSQYPVSSPILSNNIVSIGQASAGNSTSFPQCNVNIPINQNCPQPNHHMNYYTPRSGINSNSIKTSPIHINEQILQQRSIQSGTPSSNVIQNMTQMPSQSTPNQIQTPHRTNIRLPPFETLKNSPNYVTSQINSNINDKDSNFYSQYLMDTTSITQNDVAQQNNYSTVAENNSDNQPSVFADQQMFRTTPEMLSQRQRESWIQQQQKLLEESQLHKLIDGSHWQRDLDQINMSLFPLLVTQDAASPAVKSVDDPYGVTFEGTASKEKKFPEEHTNESVIERDLHSSKEIITSSNSDLQLLFDSSVRRKLFPTDSAEEDSILPDKDVTDTPRKKKTKELDDDTLPSKRCKIKDNIQDRLLNSNSDNAKLRCITPGIKIDLCEKNGNSSWGFLDETRSPDNSGLVIDTDIEYNSNNEGAK